MHRSVRVDVRLRKISALEKKLGAVSFGASVGKAIREIQSRAMPTPTEPVKALNSAARDRWINCDFLHICTPQKLVELSLCGAR